MTTAEYREEVRRLKQLNSLLLEALQLAREYLNHPGGARPGLWNEANEKARAAIAAATGEKS